MALICFVTSTNLPLWSINSLPKTSNGTWNLTRSCFFQNILVGETSRENFDRAELMTWFHTSVLASFESVKWQFSWKLDFSKVREISMNTFRWQKIFCKWCICSYEIYLSSLEKSDQDVINWFKNRFTRINLK